MRHFETDVPKLKLTILLGGVDGETDFVFTTPRVEQVRKFLEREDHEGSSLTIHAEADGEDAYRLLERLDAE